MFREKIKVLDCTVRDGGLMNNHDFSDDFVRAVQSGIHPPISVWEAAKYAAPGIIAHASAERNGEMLPVPDFGDKK